MITHPDDGNVCIVTHKNCGSLDGMVAAWILSKAHPGASITAAYHDSPPPIVDLSVFSIVIFVDVAFGPAYFKELRDAGVIVLVLDHHATAHEQLKGTRDEAFLSHTKSGAGLAVMYAETLWISRSGAVLIADLGQVPPSMRRIAEYVQDYDLWQHRLPMSRAMNLYLQMKVPAGDYVKGFAMLDDIATMLENTDTIETDASKLEELLAFQIEAAKKAVRMIPYQDLMIPVVNLTNNLPKAFSDFTLGALAVGHPFVVGYSINKENKVWMSIRADNDSGAARRFAEANNGGGHERACGCSMTFEDLGRFLGA